MQTTMEDKKSFKASIPLGADLENLFPDERKRSKAQAILQHIFIKRIQLKQSDQHYGFDKDQGWCPVASKNLRQIAKGYEHILKVLLEAGVVEVHLNAEGKPSYQAGIYTKLYRLRFKGLMANRKKKFEVQRITHPERVTAIQRYYFQRYDRKKELLLEQCPWYKRNIDFIDELWIDVSDEELTTSHPEKADYLIEAKNNWNEGINRHVKRDTMHHRIHSHLSNLSGDLRQHLKVRGEDQELVYLDVANSHPAFLSQILKDPETTLGLVPEFLPLKETILAFNSASDINMFHYDCVRIGKIYERVANATNMERDVAKTKMLEHIQYCRPRNFKKNHQEWLERERFQLQFKMVFPTVFALLWKLKYTRRNVLSVLQNLRNREGKLVPCFNVPNLLVGRLESVCLLDHVVQHAPMAVGSLHDGFLMRQEHELAFRNHFVETFQKLGLEAPKLVNEEEKRTT